METKKQNCNWFTWHVLPTPKDYPIQSVVEFVVLITSLVALLVVYGSVNHVNVIDEELNIAYLDKLRYSPNHSVDNIDSLNEYKKSDCRLIPSYDCTGAIERASFKYRSKRYRLFLEKQSIA